VRGDCEDHHWGINGGNQLMAAESVARRFVLLPLVEIGGIRHLQCITPRIQWKQERSIHKHAVTWQTACHKL
jgi:hypothetical protein